MISPFLATALNILLAYAVGIICRVEFLLENYEYFAASLRDGNLWHILWGGLVFDTPGVFYVNALYILLMLFPLHFKERRGYHLMCKWVFVVLNSVAMIANLADSVYFPFTMKRTTWDTFAEFGNETNLGSIFAVEMIRHWYLVLLAALLVWLMWKYYAGVSLDCRRSRWSGADRGCYLVKYYVVMTLSLAVAAMICVPAIRGGWLNHWYCYILAIPAAYAAWRLLQRRPLSRGYKVAGSLLAVVAVMLVGMAPVGGWRHRDIRPIALSNANAYARRPVETALILNTPFAMIRTVNSNPFRNPQYFSDSEAKAIYSPEHRPEGRPGGMTRKNVVVIIMESVGEEYIGSLNTRALGADRGKPGYAPFLDSIAGVSMRFTRTYDNGSKSIDAMPSILAGIPKFIKPFILTSSAMQPIDALPALLAREGYSTAFFHGARTGSMGFDGFARMAGFERYYGREDFEKDPRFGGEKEFDGYWAIWDGPFLKYYAAVMSGMKQPFMTSVFTATSHHPFNIPAEYKGKFPEGTMPIHKCIGYVDNSLREFFEAAKKEPWYENTIFVITNDHTNAREYDEYRSDIGAFYGPLLIFDPSGETAAPGVRDAIAQQTDIMPTVLGLLGYDKPYVAYGVDLTSPSESRNTWAVNTTGNVYQYVRDGYVLQFDGMKSIGLYAVDDHLMAHNLISDPRYKTTVPAMERELKGMIQVYMMRRGR